MKRKWICILLAMLCLTGCGGAEDTPEETVPDAEQTAAVETEPEYTREEYPDDLPERDFGGKDYVICSTEVKRYEVLSDELTGEACNDAVYHRNVGIEERFNTKISSLIEWEPESVLRESAISGDNAFEVAGYVNYKAYAPIAAHAAMNWNDIPYVDQSKPWHNQLANEPATINGKLFAINSDLSISSLQYTYGIFFNYKLAEDYGYTPDSLYQMVFDGTWTIDTFREMVQDIWVDVDGDAEHDRDDIHGYSVCPGINTSDVWLAALDLDLATLNNDGTYSVDFFNEKTVSALEKCMALTYDGVGTYNLHQDWRQVPVDFASGKVMMTQMYFGETTESLKDMEDTYGILPLPKFDETQQAYYTNAWDQFSVFSVPVTAEDLEFVGILYEALSAETWRSVYPAYYDTALKSRYSAEANVAKIVDMIMEGRKFEFSFQFGDELQDLPYMFRAMLRDKTTDIASRYNAIESKLQESIKVMYSYYE